MVDLLPGPSLGRRIAASRCAPRVKAPPDVLARSLRAPVGFLRAAASERALVSPRLAALHASRRPEEQMCSTTSEGQTMSATTTHTHSNSDEALFLAPKPPQKAEGEEKFLAILQEALTKPGIVNAAYRAFHNYSIGNQLLAAMQLTAKGLALTPIASFNAWKDKGRFVKKGQKALSLFMPVSVKRKEVADAGQNAEATGGAFNVFMLRANWFSLDQTEGDDFVQEVKSPEWDAETALDALQIAL